MIMRKGGGKNKGASFERSICAKLSRFIDPKGTDTIFWRSAMSGGRATIQNRKGVTNKTQLGDITCVHPSGSWLTDKFFIECKNYADLNLISSIFKGKGKLAQFWTVVRKEANKNQRLPMLIAKQNNIDILILVNIAGWNIIKKETFIIDPIVKSAHLNNAYIFWFRDIFG